MSGISLDGDGAAAPPPPAAIAWIADATPAGSAAEFPAPIASNRYVRPRGKYWLRLTIEEAVLLGLGEVQYQVSDPQAHYTLPYDWTTVWQKLTWQKLGLDPFPFDNDQLSHPGAGAVTYVFARSNGLSLAASSTVTVASAILWKQFGEFQEDNFLNSVITTSFAGVAIGEAASQLASFLDAGRSTVLTRTLSFLVDPPRKVHDWIDGAEPLRTTNVDSFGLSRDVGATLRLTSGLVVTRASSSERSDRTFDDLAVGVRTHVVNIPGYDDPGRTSRWWDDGNESDLAGDLQLGARGLDDVYLLARVAPAGWFTKSVTGRGEGREGQRFWIGPTVGFDYVLHDYDRLGNGSPPDRFSTSQLGLELEHDLFFRHGSLRSALAIQGQFGPVQSLALNRYLTNAGDVSQLPEVVRAQGFYWSWGFGAAPAVELRVGPVRAGGLARLDAFRGTYALQAPTAGQVSLHDWAFVGDAWIGVLPVRELELAVDGRWRVREGVLDATASSRGERSILTTATLAF
ncbi:MAG TPA: DUF3943 domain-containing protein [Polyangiaceae bacterium]|nr:DUF3943 domain-containing protein [Polyangiaceae bacterium]